jgi:segregation and condensation protein B
MNDAQEQLSQKIEAVLFLSAEPVGFKALSERLGASSEEIKEAAMALAARLTETASALMLITTDQSVTLATKPEFSSLLESLQKDAISKDLTKAAAETLSIILYQPGITRASIEFIRGVNATYSLRNLSMRGLIEARQSGRGSAYYPTAQFLEHLGVAHAEALPEYAATAQKITALLSGDPIEDNTESQ